MGACTFKALGTHWSIVVDGESFQESDKVAVRDHIAVFEERFSRFLSGSLVNQFRAVAAGEYEIDSELALLLQHSDRLRELTDGVFDPAAGELLERAGYDASYRLEPSENALSFELPHWSLHEKTLILDGPTAFDLGATGKGYCIDHVCDLLKEQGHNYFLVEAGGDMYGTTKQDGSPWRVAIQYPGKPDTAAGVVELSNKAVAVSDSFRRKWGKWHHIINPKERRSVEGIIGAVAVAKNPWHADSMTSLLFLGKSDKYEQYATEFEAQYLVFYEDDTTLVSTNWEGEMF